MAVEQRFACSSELDGERGVVRVSGDLDMYTAPRIRTEVGRLIEAGVRHIIFDLTDVHFVDSTALGVILGAITRIAFVRGRVVLVSDDDTVLRVLRLTRLDQVMPLFRSLGEAEAALMAPAEVKPISRQRRPA